MLKSQESELSQGQGSARRLAKPDKYRTDGGVKVKGADALGWQEAPGLGLWASLRGLPRTSARVASFTKKSKRW